MLCAHEGAEGREREKKISLIYLLASEIPTTARIGPGQNQEPGTAYKCPSSVRGTQGAREQEAELDVEVGLYLRHSATKFWGCMWCLSDSLACLSSA